VAAFEEGEDVELRPHKQSKRRKDFVKKKKGYNSTGPGTAWFTLCSTAPYQVRGTRLM
jgi:hypothetical protein